ncbi:hypothetical protein [Kutzneria sp. NPDC051319]|uniref:hypothetical protein n=1 Tax=Kutzneria sp. NPDC051319 TaxID=3155047 RepID=UPI0034373AFA
MIDVTFELITEPDGSDMVAVKVQASTWQLNLRASREELSGLDAIRGTDWTARRCLHIGECAGSGVHWAIDDDTVTILVGEDDETWDVAVSVPVTIVDQIVADCAAGNW